MMVGSDDCIRSKSLFPVLFVDPASKQWRIGALVRTRPKEQGGSGLSDDSQFSKCFSMCQLFCVLVLLPITETPVITGVV